MVELICHLCGDYLLQNHAMAMKKVASWRWAAIHVAFYMVPFLVILRPSVAAVAVMAGTHLIIDRFRLAKYWVVFWGVGCEGWLARKIRERQEGERVAVYARLNSWDDDRIATFNVVWRQQNPLPSAAPDFLAVWLLIIVDNTIHLAINHMALANL